MKLLLTSAHGHAQAQVEPAALSVPAARRARVTVDPARPRQEIIGIGTALTQASAVALSTLPVGARAQVLADAFGPAGGGFSVVRTPIGSCDFSTSSYCYAPDADPSLAAFSLQVDDDNGHLDLLRDAAAAPGADFRLIASPWTAPPWMKDNGRFFDTAAGRGGRLLPEHHDSFARYTARYCEEMAARGLPVWGLTPVNEPVGNSGAWESMEMSPAEQTAYVATLGRVLRARGLHPRILVYDQNRRHMRDYTDLLFSYPASAPHAWGTAVHWYDSTFRVYEDELDALHAAWPDRAIVQTEGCIDSVYPRGEPRGPGAPTPWWRDDAWFWRKEARDWGWSWAPEPERSRDHPPYAPAFRYARDLVGGLGHWLSGWVDWNLVLTRHGGPNHVGNYCLAPVLVDGDQVYRTPLFDILCQVSRTTRPGAVAVHVDLQGPPGLWAAALVGPRGEHVLHLFNEAEDAVEVALRFGGRHTSLTCPSAALLTAVMLS